MVVAARIDLSDELYLYGQDHPSTTWLEDAEVRCAGDIDHHYPAVLTSCRLSSCSLALSKLQTIGYRTLQRTCYECGIPNDQASDGTIV